MFSTLILHKPSSDNSNDFVDLQIAQLLPSSIDPNYRPKRKQTRSEIRNENYSWDERKQGELESSTTDGMATTESNCYLGAASSAALINLIGGGFFMNEGKVTSPVSTSSSNLLNHGVISRSKLEHYINQYFETYHISYPMVHKPMFMAQFNEIVSPPNGWESLLYIVAAIGSFMSAVSPEENDDLILFEIAKSKLSIDVLETGNLTLVQTLTLMSNYLQKRDKPNSGYNYLGLAVRMALGLGLHKQISDTNESLLDQETKRRIWWCLYIFDCGQTITYGRPLGIPCAGIDSRLPLNILDTELTGFTISLPKEQDSSTDYTSLRLQSLFHIFTNSIYERIITDPFPSSQELLKWDEMYIQRWKNQIPEYFKEDATVPPKYRLAHAVIEWRVRNLRIIMYRTFLLRNVVVNSNGIEQDYDSKAGEICLQECSATVKSMYLFWSAKTTYNRMDAWYSLFFLIPAVVMPLVCLRNNPLDANAEAWRSRILHFIEFLGAGYLTQGVESQELSFPLNGTDESPFSQLIQLHSMLWPVSFDIEQQFL
ncbi:hypothetical protein CANTEDRAFT_129707 [Yamadazyma tenuis ATCC 10573]|uniref:Xylanolytic transcriptional activator regulatory domain-containing protein n=1 Tax=Candida tenuis (strain ATCC 10573 / BCRC 21748 / CBS 615 / JCM 9827 / NBRC 10315 / NRRL Y-1498 / VKM Y-70) TaxID=590646 RepID=G3B0R0_CANTC|nr:uncharacterized protein CANTEDRAFT_129707 [Yamadazyma tenuis ATCC 10573]EGV65453.1 hypothetical protein CANTEDRAFT_129707 [Yamadazyma tenuis ATCC 10573]